MPPPPAQPSAKPPVGRSAGRAGPLPTQGAGRAGPPPTAQGPPPGPPTASQLGRARGRATVEQPAPPKGPPGSRPGPPPPGQSSRGPQPTAAPAPPASARPGPGAPYRAVEGITAQLSSATISSGGGNGGANGSSALGGGGTAGTVSSTDRSSMGRGTTRGGARTRVDILRTRPDCVAENKKGNSGNTIDIWTNYFALTKKPDTKLNQWR
jgi:hypothetical protein